MNRLKFFVKVIVACLLSNLVWANDSMTYVRTDADVISSTEAVVQGMIISIATYPPVKKGCFTNVYKLQVDLTFKGHADEGEIIQVGSINNRIELSVGDTFLVFLNKPIKNGFNYYQDCRYPSLDKSYSKREIMITTGSISSSFHLNSGAFNIIGCGTSKRILFQEALLKINSTKQSIDEQCNKIEGNYDVLIQIMEKSLSQL